MMQRQTTIPTGPKSRGHARNHFDLPRSTARGGIQKKRGGPARTDRDGDLDMDGPSGGKSGAGHGRGGRSRANTPTRSGAEANRGRSVLSAGPQRGLFSGASLQKAIARGLAAGVDSTVKSGLPRNGTAHGRGRYPDHANDLEHIAVRGLRQSKAAGNPDGGVKDLLGFLERKASGPGPATQVTVRIRKSRMEGDVMVLSVTKEDSPKLLRLNGFSFAGTTLAIEAYDAKKDFDDGSESADAVSVRQRLTAVLNRRYDAASHFLDLSALGQDPDLVSIGTFDSDSTSSKFFPALMRVCDSLFTSAKQKREAVASVSLANNELKTIGNVSSLALTFPDLKNIDLSNNRFESMRALNQWRWRFRHLQHLILSGNPIEKVEANYKDEVMRWYPSLRLLNTVQVRTEEELANAAKLPLPIRGPSFRDEGQIAENFLRSFFPAYDSDRAALASNLYDHQSTFSYSINTSAPRGGQAAASQPVSWDSYIKGSRNLLKINHLSARMSRIHVGHDNIRQRWSMLPATRHPDLLQEGQKWLIECHSIPALPDPSGQSPAGVGGLLVLAHGQFDEINVTTGQTTITRSFDRTFILGPGSGPMGVRVISDVLVYRAYGGFDAWVPEETEMAAVVEPTMTTTSSNLQIPPGFGEAAVGKAADQVTKEQMVMEMSKRTGMTLAYSQLCLEEIGYDFEGAYTAFESVRATLPPDAFIR